MSSFADNKRIVIIAGLNGAGKTTFAPDLAAFKAKLNAMKAPVSHSKDPDLQKVPQALLRAAEKARQLAEQIGTRFVVRKPAAAKQE